jgi:hypothetical protein
MNPIQPMQENWDKVVFWRWLSSGIQLCVVIQKLIDVSDVHSATIKRVISKSHNQPNNQKINKGHEMSSPARLNHSSFQNAQLELANSAL